MIVNHILMECLKMWRIYSTWVSHFLSSEQLSRRVAISKEWLKMIENNPNIFRRVAMCDESWMHYFKSTLRQQINT